MILQILGITHHHRPPPTIIVYHHPPSMSKPTAVHRRPSPPPPTTVQQHHHPPPPVYFRSLHTLKNQTFFLQTAEVWSFSFSTDVCRCGLQTADVLHLKNKEPPK
ncbi:hypothetical protein HanHA300_Chr10g0372311 [Helianthus annuus]|nr:hypothetical protein HanHA300_Chr10g0372311 [Helianthus annuus]KAJ0522954.1 hypothetical protein HanIR_Chr10g0488391 [Helianthus annuus]KAJ0530844.1 hypothetical protein HanHA89_Chr10g0394521 [Helianthus annuus]KAJ0697695.1 hypothetical protein HanLR1_Chr10g0371881 [Helianthus annuus]KAJ0701064.1 hypothetical protein HanOQP8_Chr10g0375241 [Helianthus annuus]